MSEYEAIVGVGYTSYTDSAGRLRVQAIKPARRTSDLVAARAALAAQGVKAICRYHVSRQGGYYYLQII